MTGEPSPPAPESAAPPPAARREQTGCVLGTSAALGMAVLLLAFFAYRSFGGSVDGAARVSELFGGATPPFGLALAEAARLPTGDEIVRLTPGDDAVASGAPVEVVFIRYRSAGAVRPLFGGGGPPGMEGDASQRLQEWEKKKDFDWHTTLERDEIAWGEWRTALAIERAFSKDGHWQDSARVDLSQPERALVLFAQWPDETPVDRAKLKELLGAITMRPAP